MFVSCVYVYVELVPRRSGSACSKFSEKLKEVYEKLQQAPGAESTGGQDFEVIYIHHGGTEDEFRQTYTKDKMPWLAVHHRHRKYREELFM